MNNTRKGINIKHKKSYLPASFTNGRVENEVRRSKDINKGNCVIFQLFKKKRHTFGNFYDYLWTTEQHKDYFHEVSARGNLREIHNKKTQFTLLFFLSVIIKKKLYLHVFFLCLGVLKSILTKTALFLYIKTDFRTLKT